MKKVLKNIKKCTAFIIVTCVILAVAAVIFIAVREFVKEYYYVAFGLVIMGIIGAIVAWAFDYTFKD